MVEVAESVAVSDEELAAVDGEGVGMGVHVGADFLLEVVEEPHVVVADVVVDLDAAVGEAGEGAEEACVSAGHYFAVGEPEVEDVAEEDEHVEVLAVLLDELA